MSVQTPLQRVPPPKHTHDPLWHVVPPEHFTPQPPQFALSVCSLTHPLPHCVRGGEHEPVQFPPEQTCPPLHVMPQPPQLLGSEDVSTH